MQAGLEPRAGLTPTPGSHGGVSFPPEAAASTAWPPGCGGHPAGLGCLLPSERPLVKTRPRSSRSNSVFGEARAGLP